MADEKALTSNEQTGSGIYKNLNGVESWDSARPDVRIAFYGEMKGKSYGHRPLRDAWDWFLAGWTALSGDHSAPETKSEPGYVLCAAAVKFLIEAAERAGVEHVTFGVMDPKAGLHPDLPGYIGVIREEVSKLKSSVVETLAQPVVTVCESAGPYSGSEAAGQTISCPRCSKLVTLRMDIHGPQIPRHLALTENGRTDGG